MARTKTPQQYRERWQEGARAGVARYAEGVNAVTENPLDKAAASLDKMVANFTASIRDGKWLAGIQGVTLQDWKNATIQKGSANLSTGIENAASKVERKAAKLLADIEATEQQIAAMPTDTLQQRIARATTFMQGMHERSRQ